MNRAPYSRGPLTSDSSLILIAHISTSRAASTEDESFFMKCFFPRVCVVGLIHSITNIHWVNLYWLTSRLDGFVTIWSLHLSLQPFGCCSWIFLRDTNDRGRRPEQNIHGEELSFRTAITLATCDIACRTQTNRNSSRGAQGCTSHHRNFKQQISNHIFESGVALYVYPVCPKTRPLILEVLFAGVHVIDKFARRIDSNPFVKLLVLPFAHNRCGHDTKDNDRHGWKGNLT